jgi:hypothetical protein
LIQSRGNSLVAITERQYASVLFGFSYISHLERTAEASLDEIDRLDSIRDALQAEVDALKSALKQVDEGRAALNSKLAATESAYASEKRRSGFQMIASLQGGIGASYAQIPNYAGGGIDIGLKFRSGTYFSVGYMAGTGHMGTIRIGQVIRLRK